MPTSRSKSRTAATPTAHIAVFPGSFDPVTYGHLDVIRRGRRLFDRLVVAVGRNPGKDPLFTPAERVQMLQTLVEQIQSEEPNEAEVVVESFSGLTVDFARQVGATVLLRGIRNLSDLQSEVQQALTNRQVAGAGDRVHRRRPGLRVHVQQPHQAGDRAGARPLAAQDDGAAAGGAPARAQESRRRSVAGA